MKRLSSDTERPLSDVFVYIKAGSESYNWEICPTSLHANKYLTVSRVFAERLNGLTIAVGLYGGTLPPSAELKLSCTADHIPRIINTTYISENK